MLEWYLHTKKQLPDDPLDIARQCDFGQDQLVKVNDLAEEDHNKADQETGRPAFYDNAIPTEYEHSIGIRKGPMKKQTVCPPHDTPSGHTFCYLTRARRSGQKTEKNPADQLGQRGFPAVEPPGIHPNIHPPAATPKTAGAFPQPSL